MNESTMIRSNEVEFDRERLAAQITDYERAISADEGNNFNYWYLGLAYLLQGQEVEAQATWFIPIANATDEVEEARLTAELVDTLDRIAIKEFEEERWENVRAISTYAIELAPDRIGNICRWIVAKIETKSLEVEEIVDLCEQIESSPQNRIDSKLLEQTIIKSLRYASTPILDLIKALLIKFPEDRQVPVSVLSYVSMAQANRYSSFLFTKKLLEFCLEITEMDDSIFIILSTLSSRSELHDEALQYANKYCDTQINGPLLNRISGQYAIIKALLTAGNWSAVEDNINTYLELLEQLIETRQIDIENPNLLGTIYQSTILLPYLKDRALLNRNIHNQIGKLFADTIHADDSDVEPVELEKPAGCLRIGYVGGTFREHSVGWLCRWLWQHHDRDKFQIFTYAINQHASDNFYQQWFQSKSDVSYVTGSNSQEVIAQIKADEIDILIDLDSITLDISCQILAAKPAPIQVSWLGWDATGIPGADYFIADPYVLTDNADEYYREQIYRLPSTYLAVDGFEVGIPTLKRSDLDIPEDAIIYWTGQMGYKRHPDTIRLQLEIIKRVPNSYLLIKGKSDRTVITNLFNNIAAEVGVECERLRFVDDVRDSETHRANLGIADVILDTFPYNGATTTLETLWMGIPMVTKVGEQFSARNSYTFMKNAGLDEGIAWSDGEYIDWGVKLGTEPQLRADIHAKLIAARHTSDLWNAKKFTRQMEAAYTEMWERYQLTVDKSPTN